MKAILSALILLGAGLLVNGMLSGNPLTIAGAAVALPALCYLLFVAVPRAERVIDDKDMS